jgi:iron complex transport system substrate-binding protein
MDNGMNEITGEIVDAAVKLHMRLGPGLLESVYETLLARELTRRGLIVSRQHPVSFDFDGIHFDDGFRVDLLVENSVVVELKSLEKIALVHSKQVLTYLRLMNLRVGLLINFGALALRDGLHRIVNSHAEVASKSKL